MLLTSTSNKQLALEICHMAVLHYLRTLKSHVEISIHLQELRTKKDLKCTVLYISKWRGGITSDQSLPSNGKCMTSDVEFKAQL